MRLAQLRRGRTDPDAMTLAGHLAELRRRLLIAVAAVGAMGVVAWFGYGSLVGFLLHPYCASFPQAHLKSCNNVALYTQDPLGGLSFRFQVAAFGGLVLASPIVLYELWRFVTPGLKPTEKRYAVPFVCSALVLFACGAIIAYWSFEHALVFLRTIGGPRIRPIYSPSQYTSLLLLVMFLYGLAFVFPVLLVGLQLVGVLHSASLLKHWRIAIFGLFALAAVFTPTADPLSMLLLAIPLSLFYLGAAYLGRLLGK